MKLVGRTMHAVRPRFDHGIDQRAGASAKLGRISVGLNLELLQRVYGRLNDLRVAATEMNWNRRYCPRRPDGRHFGTPDCH